MLIILLGKIRPTKCAERPQSTAGQIAAIEITETIVVFILTGNKNWHGANYVFYTYIFQQKRRGRRTTKIQAKVKDQRKGGKTQRSRGQQKEQATKAQRI